MRSQTLIALLFLAALSSAQDQDRVDRLIASLQRSEYPLTYRIVDTLVRIGQPAVAKLASVTEDEHAKQRGLALQALGRIGGDEARAAVLKVFRTENRNYDATVAIGDLKEPSAVPKLIERVNGDTEDSSAMEALGKIGDEAAIPCLVAALKAADKPMGGCGSSAGLIATHRYYAAVALGRLGEKGVQELLRFADSSDEQIRACVAHGLGASLRAEALPILRRLARDSDAHNRSAALKALSKFRDKSDLPLFVAALRGNETSLAAAEGLASLGDERAIGPLVEIMQSANYSAMLGLVGIDTPEATKIVLTALAGPNARNAADAIRWSPSPRFLSGLASAICRAPDAAGNAAHALFALGPDGVDAVKSAAMAANDDCRESICRALGDIDDERVIPILLTAVHDESAQVGRVAMESLQKIRTTLGMIED